MEFDVSCCIAESHSGLAKPDLWKTEEVVWRLASVTRQNPLIPVAQAQSQANGQRFEVDVAAIRSGGDAGCNSRMKHAVF